MCGIIGSIEAKDVGINTIPMALPWANVGDLSVPLLRATLALHGRWLIHIRKEEEAVTRPDFTRFSVTAFAIVVRRTE